MKEWRTHLFLLVPVQVLFRIVVKISNLEKSTETCLPDLGEKPD